MIVYCCKKDVAINVKNYCSSYLVLAFEFLKGKFPKERTEQKFQKISAHRSRGCYRYNAGEESAIIYRLAGFIVIMMMMKMIMNIIA